MENLNIGVDNFIQAINNYYVDKTLLIKDFVHKCKYQTVLFTKPRRFGKTLNLSMLDYFFSNKGDYLFAFKDKKICNCDFDYQEYINKFPVIHLNMKDISSNNLKEFIQDIINELSRVYKSFPELLNYNFQYEIDKETYLSISNKKSLELNYYSTAIKNLSDYLYQYYQKPVVILIDEYDTPLNVAFQKGFFDEVINFFRKLYSSALKSNGNLLFSVLTGVFEISKESIFSELNNTSIYTVMDESFSKYFGFTTEEVNQILNDFNINTSLDELKLWYGGYGNSTEIFNLWSILNFVNHRVLMTYWNNTGSNFAITSILKNDVVLIDDLNDYINGNKVFLFYNGISFDDLYSDIDILLSLLVHAGYLKAKLFELPNKYYVSLPNLEITTVFEREIISKVSNTNFLKLANDFRIAIEDCNDQKIQNILTDMISSSFSCFDLNNEKEYQTLITGIMAILFGDYLVKSEVVGRNGRSDIMLSPKEKNKLGIIIELKKLKGVVSKNKISQSATSAIKQIENHNYYQELVKRECKKIFLYAFVFDDKNSFVKSVKK